MRNDPKKTDKKGRKFRRERDKEKRGERSDVGSYTGSMLRQREREVAWIHTAQIK